MQIMRETIRKPVVIRTIKKNVDIRNGYFTYGIAKMKA